MRHRPSGVRRTLGRGVCRHPVIGAARRPCRGRSCHKGAAMRVALPARWIAPVLLLAIAFFASVAPVRAASFVVTRFDDPTPGGCNPGDCSLREAVMAANAAPGSTITLSAGTYTLTIPGADETAPNTAVGDLDIFVA